MFMVDLIGVLGPHSGLHRLWHRSSSDFHWGALFTWKSCRTFLIHRLHLLNYTLPPSPTLSRPAKISSQIWLLAPPGGALTTVLTPINYAQNLFIFLPLGVHLHPLHPLATPMGSDCTVIPKCLQVWWYLNLTLDLQRYFCIFWIKKFP